MINREKIIQQGLKNGIISMKPESQSVFYDISSFKQKKWFEIKDLYANDLINKLVSCYIINSKKGVGKTYQMKQLMLNTHKRGRQFIFVRRLVDDIYRQKLEWETDESWPFFIKRGGVYHKKTGAYAGMVTTVGTLYNMTGMENPKVTHVFFDEFKDKRGIARYVDNEFKKFAKFLTDVQRVKDDLKIYMFSNDETNYDPYTTGLRIDSSTDYFIDLKAGFFYVNLRDFYQGAINEDTVGYRLSMYDEELREEFDKNTTVHRDDNNMMSIAKAQVDEPYYYFYLNKNLYLFGFNTNENYALIKAVRSIPKAHIRVQRYALTTIDYTANPNTYRPANQKGLIGVWVNLLNANLLWFIHIKDKNEIETHIRRVMGSIV